MTGLQRQATQLTKRVKQRIKELSRARDRLRNDIADFNAIEDDASRAISELESAADTLSQLL